MSTVSTIVDVGEQTGLVDTGERRRSREARNVAKKLQNQRKAGARRGAGRPRAPSRRKGGARHRSGHGRGGGAAPWIVTLLIAAASGFGGYYLFERYRMVDEALADTRSRVAVANQRAADAEEKLMGVEAELARARGEFAEQRKAVERKEAQVAALNDRLEALVSKEQAEVVRNANGTLSLQLVDKVLFRLGEAELTPKGQKVIGQVGEALNEMQDKQLWVQGHTDDIPISEDNESFDSNWELSAARALNVVDFLQTEVDVDPGRLAVVAFGQHRPVSRTRKWKNRRIEIVLAPRKVRVIKE